MSYHFESVLKGINFIENNLNEEISTSDIASKTGFSKFHFIRIFKVISKDTIFEYIRKRRLTDAAIDLIETDMPIIDIAFKYAYNSQEAFTRAFENYYSITPKKYKKLGVHLSNLYKVKLTKEDLKFKNEPLKLQYKIVERKEFYIVGMEYTGKNSKKEVPKLFNEFIPNIYKIKGNIVYDGLYGLDTCNENFDKTEEFTYLVGVAVSNIDVIPEDMVMRKVNSNKYAVFTLPNTIEDIPCTINSIYTRLFAEENLMPIDNYAFEFYGKDFRPNKEGENAYLYIPIK
ncbi:MULTISPECIES: effector binding domain-containing protein [Clostridium]|uniref:effector binding domain-containing protein n=1 Tax=Clostridium TaxID=1485 RepID=UPI000825C649|nr:MULTISPECIES: effector binding domain-containing protein [Clostridium]